MEQRRNFDRGWRFAFGHPSDTDRDFTHGTRYFTYLAKAGFGDGPADRAFDDRGWRALDLPHDWAVELPFSAKGSHSHGYAALGHRFPDTSVAWYRKNFHLDNAEFGRRLWIEFDGIFRDAQVWVNGFYLGREAGGYLGCRYDMSECLNYGGENTIAVRVDARMEEGWFYEGAGIYRHVWLSSYDPVHIEQDGIAVHCEIEGLDPGPAVPLSASAFGQAAAFGPNAVAPSGFPAPSAAVGSSLGASASAAHIRVETCLVNHGRRPATARLEQSIVGPDGRERARATSGPLSLAPLEVRTVTLEFTVDSPKLWNLEHPALHEVSTKLFASGGLGGLPLPVPGDTDERLRLTPDSPEERLAAEETTRFGIRSFEFTADRGFFLNGRHVKLVGTNNHQDHAGIGVALPDAMQEYRIRCLKAMGSNAWRCSHNPPTPELLDACDRLGMLVIDENRLMGTTDELHYQIERMIRRDRNHPSVLIWSLGNEEWAIEGNILGARIALAMQDRAQRLDPSRRFTVAISGGWGHGISTVLDVMGYNYIAHGSTDEQHRLFPDQPGIGTEETTTQGTRGIYQDDRNRARLAPVENGTSGFNAEIGWRHYADREYLAGLFYWTGFDYRGEPVPFEWPAVASQFGILDTCGFPKDGFWYLKSWWGADPVLKLAPHWNWKGAEGTAIRVWAYSNADEVELTLNGKSLGKKAMPRHDHLEWQVSYEEGRLEAVGYRAGKVWARDAVETTGVPSSLHLELDPRCLDADGKPRALADGRRIAVVTASSRDASGRLVPDAEFPVTFSLEGEGRILGVGNGDPASHEVDQFLQTVRSIPVPLWRFRELPAGAPLPELGGAVPPVEASWAGFDRDWPPAFVNPPWTVDVSKLPAPGPGAWYRSSLSLDALPEGATVTLLLKTWSERLWLWVNGHLALSSAPRSDRGLEVEVPAAWLVEGPNCLALFAEGLGEHPQRVADDFAPLSIRLDIPAAPWRRRLFSGLAQIILEVGAHGRLTAISDALAPYSIDILENRA